MDYRALTVSAVLAAGVVGFAPICRADIVASDQGIVVQDAGVAAPARGMSMAQVASKFGDPVSKVAAVGKPPISRWEYSGFVVYFERDHVIHAVVSASAPAESSGAASPPARCGSPRRGDRVLRRYQDVRTSVSGPRDPALRQLLGASRHHLGALENTGGAAARARGGVGGGHRDTAAAARPAQLHRGALAQGPCR